MREYPSLGAESAEIFTDSPDVPVDLRDFGLRVAEGHDPVLLTGERGSGKDWIAHRIHELSRRAGRFIEASMAHVPEHLEVPYFTGYAKGAFSGADHDQPGLIEQAHRGTLFLNELALAAMIVQGILLTVLDSRIVVRMGETRRRPVDVRIIAATNADLLAAVAAGRFRADLLDRFGYLVFSPKPLRERRKEILALADDFLLLKSATRKLRVPPQLSPEVEDLLEVAPWSGNVRRLEHAINFAVLRCGEGSVIDVYHLPLDLLNEIGPAGRKAYSDSLDRQIDAAMKEHDENKTRAAASIGMSRRHLHRLLKKRSRGETS